MCLGTSIDILLEKTKNSWPEWQLKINQSHSVIDIIDRFHKNRKKLELSSNIADCIRIINETFLQFMPTNTTWNPIRKILERAREENDPELVIKAYTYEQYFTKCLNNHLTVNSHHFLKLDCTIQKLSDFVPNTRVHPSLYCYFNLFKVRSICCYK